MAPDSQRDDGTAHELARARKREQARRYREAHREERAAALRAWREKNPERSRELNRESMRRSAARKRAEAERRRRAVERARVWNEAHPEQRRAQLQRWRDRNREKVRAQGRESYQRNRDAIAARSAAARDRDPQKYRERSADWHARHPGYATEYGRQYRKDPERYALQLQRNRDAKRLRRRLQELSLPPRRVQRVTAADRRANAREAEAFFTSAERRAWHAQYAVFHDALDRVVTERGASLRAVAHARAAERATHGIPGPSIDDAVYAGAVALVLDEAGDFPELAGADVRRAVVAVREMQAARRMAEQRGALRESLVRYVRQHVDVLRAEAVVESRARARAGKPPAPLDVLAHRIAFDAVRGRLELDQLTAEHVAKEVLAAREAHPALFDERVSEISRRRGRQAPPVLAPPLSDGSGLAR